MSFGGENSSLGTTAHTHTNAAGDGGALDTNSLGVLPSITLEKSMLVLG